LYNESLVKRGEFYINPVFLESWIPEVNALNAGKVGEPFLYPESLVKFLAVLHVKGFDYRSLEGVLGALSKRLLPFPVICYSQVCRRVNALSLSFERVNDDVMVAIDGTGLKVTNRGEWIRHKWGVRRGWVKVVIMGGRNGVIDVRVGSEGLDERRAGRGMLRKAKNVRKAFMDGLHDCRDTFNLLNEKGIEPAIKIRKNASTHAKGSLARRKEVLLYKKLGHKEWVKHKDYGRRWPLSEGIISGTKTIFNENIKAHKKQNMYHEARMKFWAYNKILKIT
jgi:hypothetical protein